VRTKTPQLAGRILDAATRLFASQRFHEVRMDDIAAEADVSKGTLYSYFHDKDELLSALADTVAEDITPPPPTDPWREQMKGLMRQVKALLERHPGSLGPQRNGPAAARVQSVGVTILERAGTTGDETERAWRAVLVYTAGAASLRSAADEFDYGLERLLEGIEAKSPIR